MIGVGAVGVIAAHQAVSVAPYGERSARARGLSSSAQRHAQRVQVGVPAWRS
jgi:hypothetical protein